METLFRLRRYLQTPPAAPPKASACELCGGDLVAGGHAHVVDIEKRRLMCTCRPCYLLFTHEGAAGGKFRSVPTRVLPLPGNALGGLSWDALGVPVGMAFFLRQSPVERLIGFYPSPAGATEAGLPDDAWNEMLAVNPTLATLEPDTEALLVRRNRESVEGWIVPIDACYELVGRVRRHWRGFDGGPEVWQQIEEFFAGLHEREGSYA